MGKPRVFTTLPAAMIGDPRPTALDIRCAAAIALHDGMSTLKGKGAGCYARHSTLAAEAKTDVTNFSKSLSRLIAWGYVLREPQLMDKRRFTLRIAYPDPAEIVGEEAPQIVGEAEAANGGFSRETDRHYSSLKEELHSVETEKLNSSEEADICMSASSFGIDLKAQEAEERDSAEAGLGSNWSFAASLPPNWANLPAGAQVAKVEDAFANIGRDPERIASREREAFATWLSDTAEACWDEPHGQQAQRLFEEINGW
jgi:hypothetical protein